MIDIVCFKQGSLYPALYATRLARMVERHMTVPHTFTVFTDDAADVDAPCQPLPDPHFLGWWSKLSIFRPRPNRVLCLDLDTVIIDNCDFLAQYHGPFAILKDFLRLGHAYGSAIMSLREGGYGARAWEDFTWPPPSAFHGDQEWLEKVLPGADLWQDWFPGKICSYKVHCQPHGRIPSGAAIVCFHGHPKQTDLPRGHFLRREWESYG